MVFFVLLGFILGSVLGSFTKALADRSLTRDSFKGRSFCPKCKTTLSWYDLIPIFSYLILKGKCRLCHKKIGNEYLLIELLMGILIAFLFYDSFQNFQLSLSNFQLFSDFQFQRSLIELIFKCFVITVLIAVTLTDLKKTLIPDRIMFPSIVIALFYLVIFTLYKIAYLYYYLSQNEIGQYLLPSHSDYFRRHVLLTLEPLVGSIGGAILVSGFFLLLIIITKGRGMGGGDVKLGFFMGLSLGFAGVILATILGFMSGALVSVLLILLGKKKFDQNIPFGPFLVLGSLITIFWGQEIIGWYLKLSR